MVRGEQTYYTIIIDQSRENSNKNDQHNWQWEHCLLTAEFVWGGGGGGWGVEDQLRVCILLYEIDPSSVVGNFQRLVYI